MLKSLSLCFSLTRLSLSLSHTPFIISMNGLFFLQQLKLLPKLTRKKFSSLLNWLPMHFVRQISLKFYIIFRKFRNFYICLETNSIIVAVFVSNDFLILNWTYFLCIISVFFSILRHYRYLLDFDLHWFQFNSFDFGSWFHIFVA